jgi:hypothetical protein
MYYLHSAKKGNDNAERAEGAEDAEEKEKEQEHGIWKYLVPSLLPSAVSAVSASSALRFPSVGMRWWSARGRGG